MPPTLDKYFNIFRQKLFEAVLLDMPQNTLLTHPPLITEFLFIEDLINKHEIMNRCKNAIIRKTANTPYRLILEITSVYNTVV